MILKISNLKNATTIMLCAIASLTTLQPVHSKTYSVETLTPGEIRILKIPNESRFTIGSDAVRTHPVNINKNELMIKAVKTGFASLVIIHKNNTRDEYRFWVKKMGDRKAVPSALMNLFNDLTGPEITAYEDKVWIRGTVHNTKDLFLIHQALENREPEIITQIELSPTLKESSLKDITKFLESFKKEAQELRIEIENSRWILKGITKNPEMKEKIFRSVKTIVPIIENQIECFSTHSGTYHFQVYLLQMRRSGLRSIGMQWNESIGFSLSANPLKLNRAEELGPTLKMLESQGKVKVLSQPEISVRSPGDAELFSGGEFPIRTQNRFFSDIQWKNFGLMLKLKILEATSSGVRLDIHTEISHIDHQLSSEDVPALQTNRMKTSVDAAFYKPLLLSGLITEKSRESIKGIPGIRSIPVFGALFDSAENTSERFELIAILIPRLNPPSLSRKTEITLPKGFLPELQSAPDTKNEAIWKDIYD